jgi:hypothetical protein
MKDEYSSARNVDTSDFARVRIKWEPVIIFKYKPTSLIELSRRINFLELIFETGNKYQP